ncbi:hypothetical protein BaRGS_00027533 [Batillaria attramentaria]|uniref:Uncharacterized protein n=1 Tax=Batillaria attramentaria TaxID=370345 RepID=A0ABD0K350_9CAEN
MNEEKRIGGDQMYTCAHNPMLSIFHEQVGCQKVTVMIGDLTGGISSDHPAVQGFDFLTGFPMLCLMSEGLKPNFSVYLVDAVTDAKPIQ